MVSIPSDMRCLSLEKAFSTFLESGDRARGASAKVDPSSARHQQSADGRTMAARKLAYLGSRQVAAPAMRGTENV